MKRREPSFLILSLAVIVPLLALSALALLGTRIQVDAAWSVAKDEARLAADFAAGTLAENLERRLRLAPEYPDPPIPGSTNIDESADRIATLRSIQEDTSAGLSSSGLPMRALAALRVMEITRHKQDAEDALQIVVSEAPSILTPQALKRADELFPGITGKWIQEWEQDETVRRLAAQRDNISNSGGWIDDWWIQRSEDGLRYLHSDDVEDEISIASAKLPKWAALSISNGRRMLAGPDIRPPGNRRLAQFGMSFDHETMAEAPVDFGKGLRIYVSIKGKNTFTEAARFQARWIMLLLLVSLAGAFVGLWIIRRVYERERRLNALKSDFVASVSHELRAPIASIRLMADALEDGKIQSNTANEFHRLISREGARLSTLIENVLDFARIEQGRKEWHREESDLRKLILDTVSLMEPLASEKGISLQTDLPDEASALVDSDAIRQALVNLIDNAVKFSPKDSSVEISLTGNQIRITDDGPGIPSSEHQRIFEKFHRLGGELRRETQGTGIGLSLVKAIAEAHGGSATVESEPGKGSTFTLTLPNA